MSFLGSAFLLAIPLIAIPLAIHMMKKRRRDVIPWGAMQFLREPSRRGQRLSQLDRWLLLAARTLILVCLVGALAQPLIRWSTGDSASGLPLQIVMLDDTRSTLSNDGTSATTFDSIRAKAVELVQGFPEATPIQVWAAGSPARPIVSTADEFGSQQKLVQAIRAYEPRGGDGKFASSIRRVVMAASQAAESKPSSRSLDVWWLGDRCTGGWPEPLMASAMVPSENQRLHLIAASPPMTDGYQLAVETLRSSRHAIAANETIQLTATIVNHGIANSPAVIGRWTRGGKPLANSEVPSLDPNAASLVQTEVSIEQAGTHEITFEIATPTKGSIDRLPADNQRSVVVEVIGELPLLVIEEEPVDFAGVPRDSDYLAAALGRNLGGWKGDARSGIAAPSAWESLFRCEVRSPQWLGKQSLEKTSPSNFDWQRYPVIVWLGGRELSDDLVDQIVRRVRQGAGLWITLDSQTDRDWLNETLLRTGLVPAATGSKQSDAGPLDAGPLVAGPLGRLVVNVAEDSMQRLHPPDPNDEILAPLSDTDRLDLDAIRIRRRIDLQLPPTETASRVLLRTFEGDSIAWMSSVGRGRLVLQALPMNPSWSNFPLSKAYVVWVLQILDQLSEPVARNFNLVTEQMFRADVESIDHEYEMEFPNKTIEDVFALPKLESVSGVVRFDQTDQPGIYRLHDRDDPSSKPVVFSVASDPSESDISSDVLARLQSIADDSRVRIHDGSIGLTLQA